MEINFKLMFVIFLFTFPQNEPVSSAESAILIYSRFDCLIFYVYFSRSVSAQYAFNVFHFTKQRADKFFPSLDKPRIEEEEKETMKQHKGTINRQNEAVIFRKLHGMRREEIKTKSSNEKFIVLWTDLPAKIVFCRKRFNQSIFEASKYLVSSQLQFSSPFSISFGSKIPSRDDRMISR